MADTKPNVSSARVPRRLARCDREIDRGAEGEDHIDQPVCRLDEAARQQRQRGRGDRQFDRSANHLITGEWLRNLEIDLGWDQCEYRDERS